MLYKNIERKTPVKNSQSTKRSVSLKGLVLPAKWDENGDVTALKLATFDEKEYAVINDVVGKELFQHVRQEIFARGCLMIDEYNQKAFKVVDFCLMTKTNDLI